MTEERPGTRLHTIWKGMKARCQSPTSPAYRYYGARGITVCEDWQTFVGFLDWALLNGYGPGLQVDRIDADGHYEPRNCRWITGELNLKRRGLPRDGLYLLGLHGRLTDESITAAEPQDKPFKLYDGKGLYLHVSPGGTRTWRHKFRFEGREFLLSMGRYPRFSIRHAREMRDVHRAQLAAGTNPFALRDEARARRERHMSARSRSKTREHSPS